jgi:hypothetical protein
MDIHRTCEEARRAFEENETKCKQLMGSAPEPQKTLLRLSGL